MADEQQDDQQDDEGLADKAEKKAREEVTLSRRQLWALYLGASTSVIAALAHGVELLHEIGLL